MPENIQQILLLTCVLGCILPMIVLAIAAFWLFRKGQEQFDELVAPDVEKLEAFAKKVQAKQSDISDKQLLKQVVNRQAMHCGIIGAVTGLGGFVTLPIALPIDILTSSRIQAAMVEYIANYYGQSAMSGVGQQVRSYLIVSGGGRVTTTTTRYLTTFLLRFVGKSLAKLVPFVGALVGFAVNYAIVQGIGRGTIRFYSRNKGT